MEVGFINKGMRINEKIWAKEIRVIDEEGKQLGVITPQEALKVSKERGYDLVEVSPNVDPPVCKIMDFGKYKYEQSKKLKEARQRRKTFNLKEIKIKPKIDEHDFQVKSRMAQRFLEKGDKVKVNIFFRGREIMHLEIGKKIMERILKDSESVAAIEKQPKLEGKNMTMILCPKPKSDKR